MSLKKSKENKEVVDCSLLDQETFQDYEYNYKGAEKALIQKDPLMLIEKGYLKIKTKDIKGVETGLASLIPNRPQRRFLQLYRTLRATGKHVRIIILKARQWGGTTIVDAMIYAYVSQQANVDAMIMADTQLGASTKMLAIIKTMQEKMLDEYSYLVPQTKQSNRIEVGFKDTRSNIFIESAEKDHAGEKYTLHYLHCSEASKYPHPEQLFKGLLPAVSKAPGTFVITESTANGVGDYFHRECKDAEDNVKRFSNDFFDYNGEWLLFFVPWMEHEEYSMQFRDEKEREGLLSSLTSEEEALLNMTYETIDGPKQVTSEQINWRRWIIKQELHGDLDGFHEMYPATIDEAFLVSGRPRFNAQRIKEIYEYASKCEYSQGVLAFPTSRERVDMPGLTPMSVLFHLDPHGEWRIWEIPDWRHEYVIAVDTAGGEEIEGTSEGKKGDYNCIEVFKRGIKERDKGTKGQRGKGVKGEGDNFIHESESGCIKESEDRCSLPGDELIQVAEYRSRIDPDLLADEAFMAYLAYGKPVIFLEVNNHGRTTSDHLKHRCPVYRREVLDEVTRKITTKLGWYTDKNTKKQMIDTLAEAIRDNWIVIRSSVLAGELRTYVRASDGTTNAQEGCFDDTVMGCALAVQAHLRTPLKDAYKTVEMKNKAVGR